MWTRISLVTPTTRHCNLLLLLFLLLLLLLIPLLLPFHSQPNSNPRVRTGSPLQIHESAQAVSYDLEVQIATEIMRLSLPLSLSPLMLLLLSLLLTFHFFHTRPALASNSQSRCFSQGSAQPTAISSARNGEHALPGAASDSRSVMGKDPGVCFGQLHFHENVVSIAVCFGQLPGR